MIEYRRETVYGLMPIETLNALGAEGWIMCAAVKVMPSQYNYIFYRVKS